MGDAETDRQLLDRYAAAGDATAFGELVRRYADFVYAAARRQCGGDAHAADDVTQAVFLVLARRAASVPRHAIGGWLFRVTRYAAADARKAAARRSRHERSAAAGRPEAVMPPDARATQEDADRSAALLDAALAALSAADREPVILRYLRGLDYPAVAAALDIGEAAARKRVTRAMARLRSRFAAGGSAAFAGPAIVAVLSDAAAERAPAATVAAASSVSRTVTGPAVALTEGVIRMFFWNTMKRVAAVVATMAVLGVVSVEASRRARAAAPGATTLQSLQGRWELVRLEDSGRVAPPNVVAGGSMTFTGDRLETVLQNQTMLGTVTVDSTRSPAWIDHTHTLNTPDKRQELNRGLIELHGDELRMVFNEKPDGDRSTAFESNKDGVNDALYVLKRAAAATTAPVAADDFTTPIGVAKAFVNAITQKRPNDAMAMTLSREQWHGVFDGDAATVDQAFDTDFRRVETAVIVLSGELSREGWRYVGWGNTGGAPARPTTLPAGRRYGALRTRVDTITVEDSFAILNRPGAAMRLNVAELIRLDGRWWVLGRPAQRKE